MRIREDAVVTSYRVCMVCTGNICRSPMAAVVLRRLIAESGLADRVEVDSAGTQDWHVGRSADHRTLDVLRASGYDGAQHRVAQFEADWLDSRDLVLVADRGHLRALQSMQAARSQMSHVRLLREFDPEAVQAGTLEVDDPYYGDSAGFDRCLSEIVAACHGVVDFLKQELDHRESGTSGTSRTSIKPSTQESAGQEATRHR